jgi:hypothetical protein
MTATAVIRRENEEDPGQAGILIQRSMYVHVQQNERTESMGGGFR